MHKLVHTVLYNLFCTSIDRRCCLIKDKYWWICYCCAGNGKKLALHQVPSGVMYEGTYPVIGNGCIVDPEILLGEIDMLEEQGIEGENITASKQQISQIMDTLIQSFKKQLDLLFSSQAMDISSDIEVMDNMLAADGLKESDFTLRRQQSGDR